MTKLSAKQIASRMSAECLGYRSRSMVRSVNRIYDEALREHSLTVAQYTLLASITLHAPIRPSDLARELNIEKSTMSRNIRLMESQGWVEARPGEQSGTQELRLTRRGESVLKSAFSSWERAQKKARAFLGENVANALLLGEPSE